MSSENFFRAKTSVALFLSLENIARKAGREKLQVSNYKNFQSDTHMIARR